MASKATFPLRPAGELFSLEYGMNLSGDDRSGGCFPVLGSNGIVGYHDTAAVNGPGIVIGRKGSIGKAVWVQGDFWPIDTTYYVVPKTGHSLRWLYYLLDQLRLETLNSATGVPGLNRDDVYRLKIPVPTEEETVRIAENLSTVDNTIDATRAVIAQTRELKTALLHDLLNNGLPGKKTKFRQVRLGDVFIERREKGIEGLPVMSVTASGLVRRDSLDRRVESDLRPDQHLLVRKGDIAYNMMRMWQGVFGLADFDGFVSPAYVVVTPTQGMRPLYAKYLFEHPATVHLFHLYSQGIVEDRLRLYFEQFRSIPLRIVAEEKVQQQIADALMAVDTRIATLSDELTRMSDLKSALSQVLLTGQVHLKAKEGRQCRKK
jgi:type I restriction enzyme S subunit